MERGFVRKSGAGDAEVGVFGLFIDGSAPNLSNIWR